MKTKHFFVCVLILFVGHSFSQVGIGTKSPHPSAALEISSTSKGLLIPRMTRIQRDAIASPAEGLEIFSTTDQSKYYFDGEKWRESFSRNYNAYYQIYEFASRPGGTGQSNTQFNLTSISTRFTSPDSNYAQLDVSNGIKILQNGDYFIEITGELVRAGSNLTPVTGRYIIKKKTGNVTVDIASCYESLGQVYQNVLNSNSIGATFPPIALLNGDIISVWIQNVDGDSNGMNLLFENTTLSITKKITN